MQHYVKRKYWLRDATQPSTQILSEMVPLLAGIEMGRYSGKRETLTHMVPNGVKKHLDFHSIVTFERLVSLETDVIYIR